MKNIIEHLKMYYDELVLVYEKAEKDPVIAKELSEIEEKALQEARENCILLNDSEVTFSPEKFDCLEDAQKVEIIYNLGKLGLISFLPNSIDGTIELNFSSNITKTLHCTMFSILNRLEKLDGAINIRHSEVDFNITVPLGGKNGLMKCQMLLMMLYPWLHIREKSSGSVAEKTEVKYDTAEIEELLHNINFSCEFMDGPGMGACIQLVYNHTERRIEKIEEIYGVNIPTRTTVKIILEIPDFVRTEDALIEYAIKNKPEYKSELERYRRRKAVEENRKQQTIQTEGKKEEPKYRIYHNIDIVFCIDASGSMEKHLDHVKKMVPKMCEDIKNDFENKARHVGNLRARIIVFRDYIADGKEAMLATDFFELPKEQEQFLSVVNGIKTTPYGHGPSNGLEALAYAIRSKWNTEGMKKRQVIVVFSDSVTHYLGYGKLSPSYPNGMAKDMKELTAWWGDCVNPGFVNENAKMLFIFAPNDLYWSEISDRWNNVIHYPSKAGEGIEELDGYKDIIGTVYGD